MKVPGPLALFAASLLAQRGGGPPSANASSLRFTLGGKVATNDGSPVPERVAVLLYCGGARIAVSYANAEGSFAFPQMNSASSDCEVRANREGYTSSIVSATTAVVGGSPDIGSVVIHKAAQMEGVTSSATSASAPKEAK